MTYGSGFLCRRSALTRGDATSGYRGLGQRARWAPAVKDLTNRSTVDCTRHLRLCAETVSYFKEEPRIPGKYVAIKWRWIQWGGRGVAGQAGDRPMISMARRGGRRRR
jgi:hypothetical protein